MSENPKRKMHNKPKRRKYPTISKNFLIGFTLFIIMFFFSLIFLAVSPLIDGYEPSLDLTQTAIVEQNVTFGNPILRITETHSAQSALATRQAETSSQSLSATSEPSS